MHFFDDDKDSAVAELLRRAYARKVDIDTAARHLWAIDAAARVTKEPAGCQRSPAGGGGRSRRALVAVLTSFMLVASSGAALAAVAASSATLPGDTLYSLKRSGERMRLVLAVRPETDAQVHLAIAEQRWSEVQHAAQARPDVVPGLLEDTFDALRAAESRGGPVADQAVALRTQVATSSAELALGPLPTAAVSAEEVDAARSVSEQPPPAVQDDAGTDDAATAEKPASGDAAATDAGAPALAAAAPSTAPAEPEDPAVPDAAPAPAIGDAASSPSPASSPPPPPSPVLAPAPEPAGPPPADEQPVVVDHPTMAQQPADAGDGSGHGGGGSEPARGDGDDGAPVAPTQPAPAATGEQTASPAPETAPSAPGWGRPHP